MIDLHTHTIFSDGSDNLIELLNKAQKLNLNYLSITDHDNCNAHIALRNIDVSKYFKGKIIPGIEIKCAYQGMLIEVLGYKFNIDKMKKWTDNYYINKSREKLQAKYFVDLYNRCKNIGLLLPDIKNIKFNPKKDWASVVLFNTLKSNPDNYNKVPSDFFNDFDTFSKKYCGDKNGPLFIDKTADYPSVKEAINIIRECEGLVFLPHVYIYKWIKDKDLHIKALDNLYKIDGIECFHSEFNETQINHLIDFCRTNHFLMSGGSDYHGKNKPNIELGCGKGNLKIEDKYVLEWI